MIGILRIITSRLVSSLTSIDYGNLLRKLFNPIKMSNKNKHNNGKQDSVEQNLNDVEKKDGPGTTENSPTYESLQKEIEMYKQVENSYMAQIKKLREEIELHKDSIETLHKELGTTKQNANSQITSLEEQNRDFKDKILAMHNGLINAEHAKLQLQQELEKFSGPSEMTNNFPDLLDKALHMLKEVRRAYALDEHSPICKTIVEIEETKK